MKYINLTIATIIFTSCHKAPVVEGFAGGGIQSTGNRIVSSNYSPIDRVNSAFGSLDSAASKAVSEIYIFCVL